MATLTSSSPVYTSTANGYGLTLTPAQNALTLIGRVLIAMLFVPSGWGKVAGFSGLVGYINSKGVPMAEVCAAIAIFAELGLGLALLVGFKGRWAALGLAVFTAVITPIFHNFWSVDQAMMAAQKMNFFKNYAICGGLLAFAAFGPGAFSVDGRKRA
jgi:putative oxidoreductase